MRKSYAVLIGLCVAFLLMCTGCKSEVEKQEYSLEYNEKTYEGEYTGSIEDGKPVDTGKFTYGDEGDKKFLIYEGSWDNGEMKGAGKLNTNNYIVHFPETDDEDAVDRTGTYNGEVIDGIANGNGTFTAKNDDGDKYIYEGEWKDGLCNGNGKRYFPKSKEYYVSEGNFTDGEFDPTLADLIKSLGTAKDNCPYSLSDRAYDFISKHESVFTKHKGKIIKKKYNGNFSLNQFKKDHAKVKPQFIEVDDLHINQVLERETGSYKYTYFLGYDESYNMYSMFYIGKSKKLLEDKTVGVILMPHGYSTFKATNGNNPWALSGTAVKLLD